MMNKFTIIIPIFNETESIFKLIKEIFYEFKKITPEIVIIDDGSTDGFQKNFKVKKLKKVKIFTHKCNLGKCKAMNTGIQKATNNLVCIIDGDGQNPPYEIKNLLNKWKKISEEKKQFAIVCGNRKNRADTTIKKVSSKVANKIRKFILNDDCNDTACALKIFRKTDYLKIKYFKNMHRFLPALFKMNGGEIFNIPINDRKRFGGKSKFNFNNRFWIGIVDLIRVWILIKKRSKK